MKLTLIKKTKNTSDVVSFTFKPEVSIKWDAGQYIYFTLAHEDADSRGIHRYFTIASAPHENVIMITTRFIRDNGSSFKRALLNLPIGGTIGVSSPQGELTVKDTEKKYVFIAGGIGITPFRSILLGLHHKKKFNDIILLYSNRNKEIVYRNELDVLTKEHPELEIYYIIHPERCDANLIRKNVPNLIEKTYYISGPINMVKAIAEALLEIDVDSKKIKKDYFPGY